MMNNKLIPYKENIFTKILNFFKKILFRRKEYIVERVDEKSIYNIQHKENFVRNIVIKENEEEKRLKKLILQYDKGELEENDISDEDIDKLIALYKKETEELNKDTLKRKIHIEKMLREIKK